MAARAGKELDRVEDGLAYSAALILCILVLGITYDVFGRRWLGISAHWTQEFSETFLLYVSFLASPWVLRQGAHMLVDFVPEMLSPRARRRLRIVTDALGCATCLFALWFAVSITLSAYQRGTLVGIAFLYPRWIILLPVPLGLALLVLEFARQVYRGSTERESTHEAPDHE